MPGPDAPARAGRTTHRIAYTPDLLAELRRLYEQTPASCEAIATANGISRPTLRKLALAGGWVRFRRRALDLSPAVRFEARLASAERAGIANVPLAEAPRPPTPDPTPDPSPPLAALAGGGEPSATPPSNISSPEAPPPAASTAAADFAAGFRHTTATALAEAQVLIAELRAARIEMQESGRHQQAAALGRDLAAITHSLHSIKRMHDGTADDPQTFDDPTDLDARRDALAHRIEIILAEWADAEDAGQIG